MSVVAGIRGVFVIIEDSGKVTYVDGTSGKTGSGALVPEPKAPLSIACSEATAVETFVVVDSRGKAWHGLMRGNPGNPKAV